MERISGEAALDAQLPGRRVLALFHSTWCPFCRAFLPTFHKLAPQAQGWTPLEVVVDDDDDPLWDRLHVNVVPTVIAFDDGRVVARKDGRAMVGLKANDLQDLLKQLP